MAIKRIDIRPFPAEMFLCTTLEDFKKIRARYTEEPFLHEAVADGCASDYNGGLTHVVGIFNRKPKVLVHELGHVIIKVLTAVNVPISLDNQEVFCYLLGDLTEETFSFLMNDE